MRRFATYILFIFLAASTSQAAFDVEAQVIEPMLEFTKANPKTPKADLERRSLFGETQKVSFVNTPSHTQIIPKYSSDGLSFVFQYDPEALKNPRMLLPELAAWTSLYIQTMNYPTALPFTGHVGAEVIATVQDSHIMAELIANAKAGSPTAIYQWAAIKHAATQWLILDPDIAKALNVSDMLLHHMAEDTKKELEVLKKKALEHRAAQKKNYETWKKKGILDKLEAQEKKLNDLVVRNDRKGVRKLLEASLPWTVMEPAETNMWKTWLEAIEHPDLKNQTVAFRGLNSATDKVQRLKTATGENVGFFSTVLTQNQGNYTRRLRSINTHRETNGNFAVIHPQVEVPSVKMTAAMRSHSADPEGSSFISFSDSVHQIKIFMNKGGGALAVRMDSRRMVPNISSLFPEEFERLVPLIVFPDEVVVYKKGLFSNENSPEMFIEEVFKKTGYKFTFDHELNLTRFQRQGESFVGNNISTTMAIPYCAKLFN